MFLVESNIDIWVFYSNSRLGPAKYKVEGSQLLALVERFDRQTGVSTQHVNIPNDQRESYLVDCKKCGTSVEAQFKSEKGIDSALTVHLFDTLDSWDRAYILSGDADFVAAVRSLRRRGKVVNGAGILGPGSSKALVRECFQYCDLSSFFKSDYSAYKLFGEDGLMTGRIEEFLKTTKQEASGRVLWTIDYPASDANVFNIQLQSHFVDVDKFREAVRDFPVNQSPADDAQTFILPIALLTPVRSKLVDFFMGRASFYQRRELRRGLWVETYYLSYRWNEDNSCYEVIDVPS